MDRAAALIDFTDNGGRESAPGETIVGRRACMWREEVQERYGPRARKLAKSLSAVVGSLTAKPPTMSQRRMRRDRPDEHRVVLQRTEAVPTAGRSPCVEQHRDLIEREFVTEREALRAESPAAFRRGTVEERA